MLQNSIIYSKDEFAKLINVCRSKSDVARAVGYPVNGTGLRKVDALISKYNLSIQHFKNGGTKCKALKRILKECPICKKMFEAIVGGCKKEKTTCSYSCANTYFRSGIYHPNWKESAYVTTCFYYHEKQCVICNETNIVEVHHYDENKYNNSPENLIPLCPTHHRYWHSRYKNLVEDKVNEYKENFIASILT